MKGIEIIGILVFVLGILILLFTFYQAYLLYEQMLHGGSAVQGQQPVVASTSSVNSVQGLAQGIAQSVVQGVVGSIHLQ